MDKCRLCYTDPKPEMCQHIFNTKFEPPIWKIIEQLSNLIIMKNDPYTKNICGQCFSDLVKYSDFRRQILDTDYRIQHEKEQLSEKTSDDCDYFEIHFTSTTSDNNDFMIKEEQIEIEEHLLKIEDESNEELNNSSVAVVLNQNIKELTIIDGINNNDKITAFFTSRYDNSNETNERQSSKCSTDSTKTDQNCTISTNNNDLRFADDNDMITSDGNDISNAKDPVGSSKNFDDNSSCTSSNNDSNGKKAESDNRKKYNTRNMNLKVDTRKTFRNHVRMQTLERSLKSNIRNKQSSGEAKLCRYKPADKKSYRCNICNKQFSQRSHFLCHERVHTGEKPFKCNICNKQFSQKDNLLRHKRVHTDEKPYKCDICDKSFSSRVFLKDHLNIHTGEKPYYCNVCDKTFSYKTALNIHLKLHRNEKEFECDFCNKQFVRKYALNYHLMTHTGEKPYMCDVCNKEFRQKSHLRNHNRRLHLDEKS